MLLLCLQVPPCPEAAPLRMTCIPTTSQTTGNNLQFHFCAGLVIGAEPQPSAEPSQDWVHNFLEQPTVREKECKSALHT